MGQVGCGAVTLAAALFSPFYHGTLELIKRTRAGTGDGLGTVGVFPMVPFGG